MERGLIFNSQLPKFSFSTYNLIIPAFAFHKKLLWRVSVSSPVSSAHRTQKFLKNFRQVRNYDQVLMKRWTSQKLDSRYFCFPVHVKYQRKYTEKFCDCEKNGILFFIASADWWPRISILKNPVFYEINVELLCFYYVLGT